MSEVMPEIAIFFNDRNLVAIYWGCLVEAWTNFQFVPSIAWNYSHPIRRFWYLSPKKFVDGLELHEPRRAEDAVRISLQLSASFFTRLVVKDLQEGRHPFLRWWFRQEFEIWSDEWVRSAVGGDFLV
jgi:hypothetical protein